MGGAKVFSEDFLALISKMMLSPVDIGFLECDHIDVVFVQSRAQFMEG